MNATLTAIWDSLRSSFWFVPSLMLTFGVALGLVMPWVDTQLSLLDDWPWPWLETTGEASRATLAAMAGALMTVTGVVFSVTMVTLSLTTSQFGSRLVRSFSEHNISQFALGTFLSTSVYCLLVLKSVRTVSGSEFAPHLSTAIGVVASICSLILLIAFIHATNHSIQAQSVVRAVAQDLQSAIDWLFPEPLEDGDQPDRPAGDVDPGQLFDRMHATSIRCTSEGYLQGFDAHGLCQLAKEQNTAIRMLARPGDFISCGTVIAEFQSAEVNPEELSDRFNGQLIVGIRRTPRQDLECAILELVEVAVRALSPGINDPFTAVAVIDYLSASLRKLAGRKTPSSYRFDEDGSLRLIIIPTTFTEVFETAFRQIRQYGCSSPAILIRLLEAFANIAEATPRKKDREMIQRHGKMVLRAGKENVSEPFDLEAIEERYERLQSKLRLPDSGESKGEGDP